MKRLLRKWLRRRIIKAHAQPEQKVFEWIYDSPVSTWKDKLFCIKRYPDKWRSAYSFLNSESKSFNEE